jgi:integrase
MLRLMPLVFVRPSELREAEWQEIDFKAAEWRIPARRMKGRRPHIVPLSAQAKRLFRQVHRITGNGVYVFASSSSESGCISIHLQTTMLKSIGFGGEISMGGFRTMAATLLSEQGWSSDAIERQLSHADPFPIRRTYNFAQYLPERRRMMQAWADYLDKLAGRSARKRLPHDQQIH